MKFFVLLILLMLVSCAEQEKTCEEKPHQSKCAGHENHGHFE